jgi:tetrahydromethanopterin S-methyltransferase subunit G
MAEPVTNELIYEVLKGVQDRGVRVEERLTAIEEQLATLNGYVATLVQSDLRRDTEPGALRARIERIERRLELTDPPA